MARTDGMTFRDKLQVEIDGAFRADQHTSVCRSTCPVPALVPQQKVTESQTGNLVEQELSRLHKKSSKCN